MWGFEECTNGIRVFHENKEHKARVADNLSAMALSTTFPEAYVEHHCMGGDR